MKKLALAAALLLVLSNSVFAQAPELRLSQHPKPPSPQLQPPGSAAPTGRAQAHYSQARPHPRAAQPTPSRNQRVLR